VDGGHRGGALSGKCKDAELVVLASWVLFMTHRTGLGLGVESRVNSRQSTKESPLNSDCPAMYQRLFSWPCSHDYAMYVYEIGQGSVRTSNLNDFHRNMVA